MTAEVYKASPKDTYIADAVAFGVSDILRATGVSAEEASTTGVAAARYATDLLLSAIRDIGVHDAETMRHPVVLEAIEVIADLTVHPENATFYRDCDEARREP